MTCPTCGYCLGKVQIPYEEEWNRIVNNKSMTEEARQLARRKLLERLGVKNYCCRMRIMSTIYEEEKLAMRR